MIIEAYSVRQIKLILPGLFLRLGFGNFPELGNPLNDRGLRRFYCLISAAERTLIPGDIAGVFQRGFLISAGHAEYSGRF